MACTTPPSGILPFHTVVSFSEGAMMVEICLSSMHPTTLLPARSHGNLDIFYEVANSGLLPDVTERCYQVNIIYQIYCQTTDLQSCETPL